jgi:hypothetical protein
MEQAKVISQAYVASTVISSVSAICFSSYDPLFKLLKGCVEALLLNFSCRFAELCNAAFCMFQLPAELECCHNTPLALAVTVTNMF